MYPHDLHVCLTVLVVRGSIRFFLVRNRIVIVAVGVVVAVLVLAISS